MSKMVIKREKRRASDVEEGFIEREGLRRIGLLSELQCICD